MTSLVSLSVRQAGVLVVWHRAQDKLEAAIATSSAQASGRHAMRPLERQDHLSQKSVMLS